MVKRAGWPKAAQVHSPENRTGQAWSQQKTRGCIIRYGPDYGKEIDIPIGHFVCTCGGIVRVDKRGYAFCEYCGELFNDHQAVVMMCVKSKITTRSFIYNAFNKVD